MHDEPLLDREIANQGAFAVFDILAELRAIRQLLQGDNGEEIQEDLE